MRRYLLIFSLSVGLTMIDYLKIFLDNQLRLVFCNVGQGDAMLIQQGFTQVLIDGGPDKHVLSCLGKYMPWFDRDIELIVATHPDSDHIGGLYDVFLRYDVARLLRSEEQRSTAVFNDLERLIKAEKIGGLTEFRPMNGLSFSLDHVSKISVISLFTENMLQDSDVVDSYQNQSTNNRSIGLIFECGQTKALLMADIEEEMEQSMMSKGLLMDVNILKVGHHGSKSSTSTDFIRTTLPETSIISVGENNKFGHPSPEVISKLLDQGSKIYRTDQDGDVVFVCDNLHLFSREKIRHSLIRF